MRRINSSTAVVTAVQQVFIAPLLLLQLLGDQSLVFARDHGRLKGIRVPVLVKEALHIRGKRSPTKRGSRHQSDKRTINCFRGYKK